MTKSNGRLVVFQLADELKYFLHSNKILTQAFLKGNKDYKNHKQIILILTVFICSNLKILLGLRLNTMQCARERFLLHAKTSAYGKINYAILAKYSLPISKTFTRVILFLKDKFVF